MTQEDLSDLIATTLRTPQNAAQRILTMNLSRNTLWTLLALVAVINTILLYAMIQMNGSQDALPSYFSAPLAMFVLMVGIMVIYVHVVYWAGLALGGKGPLDDLLALIVWLQIVRSGMQAIVLVLTLLVPTLAALVSVAAFFWGTWVLLTFMCVALSLNSLGHAFMVLAAGIVGLVLGVGFLLTMIGLVAQGAL